MLLLSIHPRHVRAILAGEKGVELRRLKPRVNRGQALIYATAPQMELVAGFQIESVIRAPLGLLWQSVKESAAVTRQEFDSYFAGLESGVAIQITEVTEFRIPVGLSELRDAWGGFQPPQGFRYLSSEDVAKLEISELRQVA